MSPRTCVVVLVGVVLAGPRLALQRLGAHVACEVDGGRLLCLGVYFRNVTQIAYTRPVRQKQTDTETELHMRAVNRNRDYSY
jgi:hypothetical protein